MKKNSFMLPVKARGVTPIAPNISRVLAELALLVEDVIC